MRKTDRPGKLGRSFLSINFRFSCGIIEQTSRNCLISPKISAANSFNKDKNNLILTFTRFKFSSDFQSKETYETDALAT